MWHCHILHVFRGFPFLRNNVHFKKLWSGFGVVTVLTFVLDAAHTLCQVKYTSSLFRDIPVTFTCLINLVIPVNAETIAAFHLVYYSMCCTWYVNLVVQQLRSLLTSYWHWSATKDKLHRKLGVSLLFHKENVLCI